MEILFNKGTAGGKPAAGGSIPETSAATFVVDVIEASSQAPVIVVFWVAGDPHCTTLIGQLDKLVKDSKGALRLVGVNIDKNQQLATQMRLQSVPTVYAFKDGRPVDGFAGVLPESQLRTFVTALGGATAEDNGIEDALAQAKEFMEQGDVATALEIYQEILAQEPTNVAAIGGTLRALMQAGEVEQAKEVLATLPPDIAKHADVVAVRTAIELAEQAAKLGPAAEFRRAVAVNADDHQSRFDLAMAYFAAGEREAAVDELLEIIRRDRTWNDDGARKQLVKLFEAFGPIDPLTIATRKRLSSLLFA
ncbi:MAG TPA: co-chaperone YbbN [Patescibacteria group bacterium]|nr:co-chaperone YbbN [Patescibacteria group bacterium]